MSRFDLPRRLCVATLFVLVSLRAQDAAPPAAERPAANMMMTAGATPAERAAEILKRFDKNGDGRIDDQERADAQEGLMKERLDRQAIVVNASASDPLRARLIERFDRNKDGRIDADERAEAQKIFEDRASDPAVAVLRADFMKRFDRNSSGKLEEEEMVAVRTLLASPGPGVAVASARTGLSETLRPGFVKRYDRNADGKIDDAEMTAASDSLRPGLEIAAARGDRFDTNFDGRLSDEEWTLARQQLQRWLNNEGALFPQENDLGRLEAVAAEVARRRAMREAAVGEMVPPIVTSVVRNPASAEEKARLEAVAAEVARRRAMREAGEEIASPLVTVVPGPTSGPVLNPTAADEQKRHEAIADEVARRRQIREQAAGSVNK